MQPQLCPVGLDCENGRCVGRDICQRACLNERQALDQVFDTISKWQGTERLELQPEE